MKRKALPTLYHFTSEFHALQIMEQGLTRGDVPTSPTGGFNAVWLTSDPGHSKQGWTAGSAVDKSEVRFTVTVPDLRKLKHWPALAKSLGVPDWWYRALDKAGGGGSENWYVYMGEIPPSYIDRTERL